MRAALLDVCGLSKNVVGELVSRRNRREWATGGLLRGGVRGGKERKKQD